MRTYHEKKQNYDLRLDLRLKSSPFFEIKSKSSKLLFSHGSHGVFFSLHEPAVTYMTSFPWFMCVCCVVLCMPLCVRACMSCNHLALPAWPFRPSSTDWSQWRHGWHTRSCPLLSHTHMQHWDTRSLSSTAFLPLSEKPLWIHSVLWLRWWYQLARERERVNQFSWFHTNGVWCPAQYCP